MLACGCRTLDVVTVDVVYCGCKNPLDKCSSRLHTLTALVCTGLSNRFAWNSSGLSVKPWQTGPYVAPNP